MQEAQIAMIPGIGNSPLVVFAKLIYRQGHVTRPVDEPHGDNKKLTDYARDTNIKSSHWAADLPLPLLHSVVELLFWVTHKTEGGAEKNNVRQTNTQTKRHDEAEMRDVYLV